MMISVDKRHDRDAQTRHDEARLLGRFGVLRHVNAARGGDRFNDLAERPTDSTDFIVPRIVMVLRDAVDDLEDA